MDLIKEKRGLVNRVCTYNKAISDPNRMKMIKIVGSSEPYTVNVSCIASVLGISQPAVTNHLKILESTGFFTRQRRGTSVFYALNSSAVDEYRALMDDAFAHCMTSCGYDFKCDTCPVADTCM